MIFQAHRLLFAIALSVFVLGVASPAQPQGESELPKLVADLDRLLQAGKWAEAIPVAERRLALVRAQLGEENLEVAEALARLGALYRNESRYADAEPLIRQALALRERMLGPVHVDVGNLYGGLAFVVKQRGRIDEAETLFHRSIEVLEKALGPDDPAVSTSVNSLAGLYVEVGRNAEAEAHYKRALFMRERANGPEHGSVAITLGGLAVLYQNIGRHDEALAMERRVLEVTEKRLGANHSDVGRALLRQGLLLSTLGRYVEAEPLLQRALAIHRSTEGPGSTLLPNTINAVALNAARQGRGTEAIAGYREAITLLEQRVGPDHIEVGTPLNNLAGLLANIGRASEAEPIHRRVAALYERVYGRDDRRVVRSHGNLAWMFALGARWEPAVAEWRDATERVIQRTRRGTVQGRVLSTVNTSEAELSGNVFRYLVKGLHRHVVADDTTSKGHAAEAFVAAQWSMSSEAAAALAQMAARHGSGQGGLASLVRQRQDLLADWNSFDRELIAAASRSTTGRNRGREAEVRARQGQIAAEIETVDRRIAAAFPDFRALASPEPLSVEAVQALLAPQGALVLLLDTPAIGAASPEETFVWVVTRTAVRWARAGLDPVEIDRHVGALRCGLDATAWAEAGAAACRRFVGPRAIDGGQLPFDHARAFALYRALFGEVADLIQGRSIILVPDGAMTGLPLHVLVTETPSTERNASIRWLARDNAVTVLPSVTSLDALRRRIRPTSAAKPYLGFGNPLLDGRPTDARFGAEMKQLAARARDHKGCDQVPATVTASLRGIPGQRSPLEQKKGLVDIEQVRRLTPLPETADELCAVARQLGSEPSDVRLGSDATEHAIKALSASGRLADFRIVHFATHGLLAGQLSSAEPGLILTPPASASADDDGYLSASEISLLKLDAEWVIMSACNTAGPSTSRGASGAGEPRAEALSGLARAFFYAQARALLVSHWEVYSEATVKLITATVTAAGDKSIGRAEAMRRAMLTLIDTGEPHEAHPAYWATFVVVGEGGVGR